jgi:hypothetical protein
MLPVAWLIFHELSIRGFPIRRVERMKGALPVQFFDAPIRLIFAVAKEIWGHVVEQREGSAALAFRLRFHGEPAIRATAQFFGNPRFP